MSREDFERLYYGVGETANWEKLLPTDYKDLNLIPRAHWQARPAYLGCSRPERARL